MGGCYVSEEVIHNNPLQYVTSGLRCGFRGLLRKYPYALPYAVVDITYVPSSPSYHTPPLDVNTPIEYIRNTRRTRVFRNTFGTLLTHPEVIFFWIYPYERYLWDIYVSDARRTRVFLYMFEISPKIYMFPMPVGRGLPSLLERKNISQIPVPSGWETYISEWSCTDILEYFGRIYLRGPSDGVFLGYWHNPPKCGIMGYR